MTKEQTADWQAIANQMTVEQYRDDFKARCWDRLRERLHESAIDGSLARRIIREMGDIMLTVNKAKDAVP